MGAGDEILATGHAATVQQSDPRPVKILDRLGKHRWHPLWEGNPRIARPGYQGDVQAIVNGSGCRPYVRLKTDERWFYTEWRCSPGELYWVRPDPRGTGRVIVEPHVKPNASPNKQWGRWQDLVKAYPSISWAQMGPPGTQWLDGVEWIETASFRGAVNVLATATAAVLPEGGLHHACAAIGAPAVVLFGAMTSPRNTGYDAHRNIWIDDPEALGWRMPHPACERAWARITPEIVMANLEGLLNDTPEREAA